MPDRILNNLPIIGGGTGGAGMTLLTITWSSVFTTIVLTAIGATLGAIIGFFVSLLLKRWWDKRERKRNEQ